MTPSSCVHLINVMHKSRNISQFYIVTFSIYCKDKTYNFFHQSLPKEF